MATRTGFHCHVAWTASADTAVMGYNLYMRNDTNVRYARVNASLIIDTAYTDSCMMYPGIYKYMVRAVKLEQTPSGTYYNMSEGIADTALNTLNPAALASFSVIQAGNTFTFVNTSSGMGGFLWDDGNGQSSGDTNFTATYLSNGSFIVSLVQVNECDADTFTQMVTVTGVGLMEAAGKPQILAFPNPAQRTVRIVSPGNGVLTLHNLLGQPLFTVQKTSEEATLDLSEIPPGLYIVELVNSDQRLSVRIQKE
jgi:PKD repeat protein